MSVSKVRRCIWLVTTIRTHSPISFDDLSWRWEKASFNDDKEPLYKKSFHNYVEAIYDMFGIRVVCERKGGYKYRLEYEGTDDQTAALIEALCMANDTEMSRRVVDYNVRYPLAETKSLGLVFDAARNNLPITFSWYIKRKIEGFYPAYFIKVEQRWYVIGFFAGYSEQQIVPFELMWMSDIYIMEESARMSPPKGFDIEKYLEFISEKESNDTFGKYYSEESLREVCADTEKEFKEHISDAYFHHLINLEFFNRIPKGTSVYNVEAYYQRKADQTMKEELNALSLSDEDFK